MTLRSLKEIDDMAQSMCVAANRSDISVFAGEACSWLHASGYNGLQLLREALGDNVLSIKLTRDALGLDLQNVSCVFLGPELQEYVLSHGRTFLRNVRHGLFLVPGSVTNNYGIGCPIDPSFALGGERSKNPYIEKLEAAKLNGVDIDDSTWLDLLKAE